MSVFFTSDPHDWWQALLAACGMETRISCEGHRRKDGHVTPTRLKLSTPRASLIAAVRRLSQTVPPGCASRSNSAWIASPIACRVGSQVRHRHRQRIADGREHHEAVAAEAGREYRVGHLLEPLRREIAVVGYPTRSPVLAPGGHLKDGLRRFVM